MPPSADAPWSWLPPAAYDISLKFTFTDKRSPLYWDKIGACFVWPPLGSTLGHVAVIDTKNKKPDEYKSKWDEPWRALGTRAYPGWADHKQNKLRWLGGYSWKNEVPWSGHYIRLPEMSEELKWRNAPPVGELAAPLAAAASGSTNIPAGPLSFQPLGHGSRIETIRRMKTFCGIHAPAPVNTKGKVKGKGKRKSKGKGVRFDDSNFRRVTKMRDRIERLLQQSSDPIPDGCKTKTAGVDYDSPPRTAEEMLRRADPTEEEKERLFHLRYYYMPEDDMCKLAFKLSVELGKMGPKLENTAEFVDPLCKEFCQHLQEVADLLEKKGIQPKMLRPEDLGDM